MGFKGIPFAAPSAPAAGEAVAGGGGGGWFPPPAAASGAPPPAEIIPPSKPPAPSLMGLFGFTPQIQKDATGWYAQMGGTGGKRYLSPKEVAQETLNQIGQTPQQDDSGRWYVSLGGRGGRRFLSEDELQRIDPLLKTMTKRAHVAP
jgi:hypothetical protein